MSPFTMSSSQRAAMWAEEMYVSNLETNPGVRARMHRQWRDARAHIVDDDDPQARLDSLGRRSHETAVQRFGTDLLTIQFEFSPE